MRFLPAVLALTFAILSPLRATDLPTIKAPLPDDPVAPANTTASIDLRNYFEVTDIVGQVVQFRTSAGTYNIEMVPAAPAATVANFLVYVNGGRFANTFIHRSDQGLGIIQGGGYAVLSAAPLNVGRIATDAPIALEYNLPNARGTIAMARTSVLNSATSEWFINTHDNTTTLGAGNAGGYAVFGRVTGTGMTVVDAIQALQVYVFNSPYGQLPLTGYAGTGGVAVANLIVVNAAQVVSVFPTAQGQNSVVTFSVTNTNPALVTATVSGSSLNLALSPGQSGFADVTVTATDSNGNAVQDTFRVTGSTQPTLTLPSSPVIREATSAAGAFVDFTVTAADSQGGALTPTVVPASGSTFAIGDTTVNANATDTGGAQVSGSFVVRVRDTTAPVVTAPGNQLVDATSAAGAVVNYPVATASDAVGVASLTYSKASGTNFPVGTTTVTVTARDAANNTGMQTFTVTVAFLRTSATAVTDRLKSGDGAPGAGTGTLPGDAVFKTFGPPALSDVRKLAARVSMVAGRASLGGIIQENGGVQTLVVHQGGAVPGIATADTTFKSFLDPVIAPGGAVAFTGTVQGGGVKTSADTGVWTDAFGAGLELALREGSEVPGLPAGAKLKQITSLSVRDGELLALLTLCAVRGLVTAGDDAVLLRMTSANDATVLLREGSELNGFPGSKIKTISVLSPALGSPGHGRSHADGAVVAKVTLFDARTVVVKIAPDGTVTQLLSTALEATPVTLGARWKSFGLPAIGGEGANFVVSATLQPKLGGISTVDDAALLFSADGSAWSIVARENVQAAVAQPGQTYASFFDPVVNDGGRVAFLATLKGPAVNAGNRTALFAGLPGAPQLVARLGDPAPDADGVLTTAVWSKFISHALPGGPGAGVIFLAETSGGDTNAKNKLGLWAVDSHGTLRRLLRTAEPRGPSGAAPTTLTLLNAAPGVFGTSRSFNSTGSIALLASFADKSQALLRVEVP